MSKNKIKMVVICEKCGKEATPDKEKSNNNWVFYDLKKHCECGGNLKPKYVVNDEKDGNK